MLSLMHVTGLWCGLMQKKHKKKNKFIFPVNFLWPGNDQSLLFHLSTHRDMSEKKAWLKYLKTLKKLLIS